MKKETYGIKIVPINKPNDEGIFIEVQLPKGSFLNADSFSKCAKIFEDYGCIPKGYFMVKYWKAV